MLLTRRMAQLLQLTAQLLQPYPNCNRRTAQLLLSAGAICNAVDSYRMTPLMLAAWNGDC